MATQIVAPNSGGLKPPRNKPGRKPEARKVLVTAKFVGGQTKAQIAKDLCMSANTVAKYLKEGDIDGVIQRERSRVISLTPLSVDVCERRLLKNDGSMALGILRGTGVLRSDQTINVNSFSVIANLPPEMLVRYSGENKALESPVNVSNGTSEVIDVAPEPVIGGPKPDKP